MLRNKWNGYRQLVALLLMVGSAGVAEASDVQVALEGSLLTVFGDNLANSIVIEQTPTAVIVTGNPGTTVNGTPSAEFPGAVLNAMEVRMEGGNDFVEINNLDVANDVYVNLGDGADRLEMVGSNMIGANLTVEGGAGNDAIVLETATVMQDVSLDGGIGSLIAQVVDCALGKGLSVVADEGADTISVTDSQIQESVLIESKGGNDTLSVAGCTAFGLYVNSDAGADQVSVSNVSTVEDVGIFTGVGNDRVVLTSLDSGKSITVSVDAGNDTVIATSVSATSDAVFEGGAGTDSIADRGITGGIKKDIKEFERRIQ